MKTWTRLRISDRNQHIKIFKILPSLMADWHFQLPCRLRSYSQLRLYAYDDKKPFEIDFVQKAYWISYASKCHRDVAISPTVFFSFLSRYSDQTENVCSENFEQSLLDWDNYHWRGTNNVGPSTRLSQPLNFNVKWGGSWRNMRNEIEIGDLRLGRIIRA